MSAFDQGWSRWVDTGVLVALIGLVVPILGGLGATARWWIERQDKEMAKQEETFRALWEQAEQALEEWRAAGMSWWHQLKAHGIEPDPMDMPKSERTSRHG